MHKLVDQINIFINTPILHISDSIGQSIKYKGLKNIKVFDSTEIHCDYIVYKMIN